MTESVCVHGLGYIGLPTAAVLAHQGYDVTGYDTNGDVRREVAEGRLHFEEIGLESLVRSVVDAGKLSVTTEVPPADYHLICVPTPLTEANQPNLSYVKSAAVEVSEALRKDDTVITESTVPPGTSHEVIRPILERSNNREAGKSFGLAYCPETVLPGDLLSELRKNDRVIGGIDDRSRNKGMKLYRSFCEGKLYCTDLTSAEFVKLVQNASRDVEIAFANQIARLAREFDAKPSEIIRLANTHPRVEMLSPGPGVGGHCLPVDPWFLTDSDADTSLIETARQINDSMPGYVVSIVQSEIELTPEKKVAVLGIAYKGNVSDTRNSPAVRIIELLEQQAKSIEASPSVSLTDPYVSDNVYNIRSVEDALSGADIAVLVTDHDEYRELQPGPVSEWMEGRVIIDMRNLLNAEQWERAGFTVQQL